MKGNRSASVGAKRTMLTVLCIVLALVLVAMLGLTVYAEYLMTRMNYIDKEQQVTLSDDEIASIENETDATEEGYTGIVVDEDDIQWSDFEQEITGESILNILLVGQDAGSLQTGYGRTDSMILCTFNTVKNTLTMTSFMRDMYVQIPGYADNRINTAYALGGVNLLNETLYVNFGVVIDANVIVDFTQFADIIDLLGGVEIELTSAESAHINKYAKGGGNTTAGVQILNGAEALAYARTRKVGADGDFGRTNRQRVLLNSLIQAYKNKPLTEMLSLMDDILPMVTTDMTKSEITGYVMELFPMLAGFEIVTQRIPVDGGYYSAMIREMAVLVPNMDVNRQALIDSLAE